MGGVERFEDLIAWQKARILTKSIYQITRQFAFSKDRGLSSQIQRAAVSIMSNVAEGFERNNPAEFHHFLRIAKASCGEVRSQLYVALDSGYIEQQAFNDLVAQASETSRVIGGLRTSVQRKMSHQRKPNN